jgi:DNA-binding PadR family transcriptional regulator
MYPFSDDTQSDFEIAREMLRIRQSGRLETALRFLAVRGTANTYAFSKECKIVYSAAHGLMKRLEKLGYIEISTVGKNEKGALTKFYRLSIKGLQEALRYCDLNEVAKVIKRWASNDESGLLAKWDYIVQKLGEDRALIAVRNSIGKDDLMGQFVKNFLDFCCFSPKGYESLRIEWIPLLSGDEQLKKTTIEFILGRISMIKTEKSELDEQAKLLAEIQRDIQAS